MKKLKLTRERREWFLKALAGTRDRQRFFQIAGTSWTRVLWTPTHN
jgi:hypothetical protein